MFASPEKTTRVPRTRAFSSSFSTFFSFFNPSVIIKVYLNSHYPCTMTGHALKSYVETLDQSQTTKMIIKIYVFKRVRETEFSLYETDYQLWIYWHLSTQYAFKDADKREVIPTNGSSIIQLVQWTTLGLVIDIVFGKHVCYVWFYNLDTIKRIEIRTNYFRWTPDICVSSVSCIVNKFFDTCEQSWTKRDGQYVSSRKQDLALLSLACQLSQVYKVLPALVRVRYEEDKTKDLERGKKKKLKRAQTKVQGN